MLLLVRPPECE